MAATKDYHGNFAKEYSSKIRDKIGANKAVIFISLPIKLAMLVSKLFNQGEIEKIDRIFYKLGLVWTAWDDFVDFYADPFQLERTHNDIEEGKCSWMVVKAIEKANESQKEILNKNYGRYDQVHMQEISCLYNNMKLSDDFRHYKRSMLESIVAEIETLSNDKIKKLLLKVVSDSDERIL